MSQNQSNTGNFFIARLYQPGSVEAQAYGLRVEDGELVLTDAEGNKIDVIDGTRWLLKIGGTGGDRTMLEDSDNKQTIISDLRLLDVLAKNSASPYFSKTAKKLKSGSFGRKLQNSSGGLFFAFGAVVAAGVVCLYVLLVVIGFFASSDQHEKGDRPGHHHDTRHGRGPQDYIVSDHTGQDDNGHGAVDNGKVVMTPKQKKEASAKTHGETITFMHKVVARLGQSFEPANFDKTLTATLMEDVEPNGDVGNIRTIKSSGNKDFDFVCQEVLSKRRQIMPPPAGLPHPTQLVYDFHYIRTTAAQADDAESSDGSKNSENSEKTDQ
jgi:hypothetical protein